MGAKLPLHWHLRYSKAKAVVAKVLGILDRETPGFFQNATSKNSPKVAAEQMQCQCQSSFDPEDVHICLDVEKCKPNV